MEYRKWLRIRKSETGVTAERDIVAQTREARIWWEATFPTKYFPFSAFFKSPDPKRDFARTLTMLRYLHPYAYSDVVSWRVEVNHCARVIQRAWMRARYDPGYAVCKRWMAARQVQLDAHLAGK